MIDRAMRLLPDRLFPRLALLLAAVLLATLSIAMVALRTLSLQPGSDQIGDLLAGQVAALRALDRVSENADSAGRGLPVLDLRMGLPPASARPPSLRFERQIETRLQQRLGARTQIRIENGTESRLWILAPDEHRWVGIAVPPFAQQALRLTTVVLSVACLLVLVCAAMFARSITRPIESLARDARLILGGATPSPERAKGRPPTPKSPHEVATADMAWTSQRAELKRAPAEVRALAAALTDLGQERQRMDIARTLMLAGISHDLRTPLTRLRYAIEMDVAAEHRSGMQMDIEEMDSLLQQFIDFARGSGAELEVQVDLAQLLNGLVAQERLDAKAWRFEGLGTPCSCTLRPLAVQRATVNLIRNAVRHGAPPFVLSLSRNDHGVLIGVRDHGISVAPAELQTLREPFARGDNARGGGGSGLGLAIAEQVAHAHGGGVRLSPASGGGLFAELFLACER